MKQIDFVAAPFLSHAKKICSRHVNMHVIRYIMMNATFV